MGLVSGLAVIVRARLDPSSLHVDLISKILRFYLVGRAKESEKRILFVIWRLQLVNVKGWHSIRPKYFQESVLLPAR